MRYRTIFIIIILMLIFIAPTSASRPILEPIQNRITIHEIAEFDLKIYNSRNTEQYYSIYAPISNLGWQVDPDPIINRIMTIPALERKSTKITVKPTEDFSPGIYLIPLRVEGSEGDTYDFNLKVYVGHDKPIEYHPSVKMEVEMNDFINPRETQNIKVYLENMNVLNLTEIQLLLRSDLDNFDLTETLSLKPLEQKEISLSIKPNPMQSPKDYYLFFSLKRGEDDIKLVEKRITIDTLTPEFDTESKIIEFFLGYEEEVTITNNGNVKNLQKVRIPRSSIQAVFTQVEPLANYIKTEEGNFYEWEASLSPKAVQTVKLKTSYRTPAIILAFIILLTIVFYLFKPPIELIKTATQIKMKEGGLESLKVSLLVKNITSRPIKHIEIEDIIPGIADVEQDVEIGTLKPTEILRRKKNGCIIKWKIHELEPKEERLITYRIKSKLNIIGTFKLPRARLSFVKRGRKRRIFSNRYSVIA